MIKAKGDSMQPKIQHGDIVFVRRTTVAENSDIVLCINDGEGLIKQYFRKQRSGYSVVD